MGVTRKFSRGGQSLAWTSFIRLRPIHIKESSNYRGGKRTPSLPLVTPMLPRLNFVQLIPPPSIKRRNFFNPFLNDSLIQHILRGGGGDGVNLPEVSFTICRALKLGFWVQTLMHPRKMPMWWTYEKSTRLGPKKWGYGAKVKTNP